jgi:hypothetical protein
LRGWLAAASASTGAAGALADFDIKKFIAQKDSPSSCEF